MFTRRGLTASYLSLLERLDKMSDRSLRLQTFLERFAKLKAAAGNDPNLLTKFDQATDELRAATAGLYVDDIEQEIFHGSEKMIAHVPAEFEHSWAEFKRRAR